MTLATEALVAQMQTFEHNRRSANKVMAAIDDVKARRLVSAMQEVISGIVLADTFAVERTICELVASESVDVPDVPFSASNFMATDGWVYLDKPFHDVKAILWETIFTTGEHGEDLGSNYGRCPQCERRHMGVIQIATFTPTKLGFLGLKSISNAVIGDAEPYAKGQIIDIYSVLPPDVKKFIVALLYFMRSKIVVNSTEIPDRSSRKKFGGKGFTEKTVNLIKLRVTEYKYPQGIGQADVEWSCRWIVRGHWRNQYYASRHVHELIWISPFVKGPEDKPLKKPGATIFDVER